MKDVFKDGPCSNLQLEIEKWACKSLSKSSSSQLPNAQETLWVVFLYGGVFKSDNLQHNMLGYWVDGTIVSATKRPMF